MLKLLIAGDIIFVQTITELLLPSRGKFTIILPNITAILTVCLQAERSGSPFYAIIAPNEMSPFSGHLLPKFLERNGGKTPVITVADPIDERFYNGDCFMLFKPSLSRSTLGIAINTCRKFKK